MSVIHCDSVRKAFRTYTRAPGLQGVVRAFVRRDYHERVALESVTLAIERGEAVGLIGENGAGKTTLVKILTGILPASSGSARLFDRDSFELRDADKRRISLVMGQRSQLWWDVPPMDSFQLLRAIYEVPEARFADRVRFYAERLQVTAELDVQLRKLSLGQRMKMEIIGALLHDPEIVFLDEPTIGLDLISRETIREFLVELNTEREVTVLLTSHDMEDIERTCRRIVILDRGRLLFDGDVVALKHRIRDKREVLVHLEPGSDLWPDASSEVRAIGAEVVSRAPGQIAFAVDASGVQALTKLLMDRLEVRDLSIERQPLEQLVKEIFTTGEVRGEGS